MSLIWYISDGEYPQKRQRIFNLSTINSTLFQELMSVGTDFESKVSVGIKNNLSDFPYSR